MTYFIDNTHLFDANSEPKYEATTKFENKINS